ncbi:MAG: protein-export chaperone SecB [Rhodospirillaceae bacterium]|jgi:preprotein translocase subunit SecB|nr:protein-export chaperone SecB [Rhodospirillaceae bacterium]MBT4491059.1 protein-export chaperone SecB [Rhodospirillaceae bacterium]MBT5193311.1 protein-export chaperone SecB [Rhodospirillaceae bacterium]MBT5897631.1 protein-export chaperone SecB [Rhodospirillaceae bacterium]MBT7759291.1 protein-export chaperone SecB [Rhodospirillaceae bacterium]
MTDDTTGSGAQEIDQTPDAPHVQVHAQYVKDLSFENPEAPQSLANQGSQPNIEVSVDVGARGLTASQFEVELRITAHAQQDEVKAFVVEVLYAGVFTLHNVDESNLKQICLIECPRLLFPFARRIVADATRDGGFPPLLLEPIDFATLYRQSADRMDDPSNGSGNGEA